jgi:hypothetical protein
MRPRSFRVGPADDNEFLAIEPFGSTPKATVSGRIGRIDRIGNDAFESKLAGVLAFLDGEYGTKKSPFAPLPKPSASRATASRPRSNGPGTRTPFPPSATLRAAAASTSASSTSEKPLSAAATSKPLSAATDSKNGA